MNRVSVIFVGALCCIENTATAAEYSFDSKLLSSEGEVIDVSVFNEGGQLPGTYSTDVILNNNYIATEEIYFFNVKNPNGVSVLTPCLSSTKLSSFGVLIENYPMLDKNQINGCADLSAVDGLQAIMNVAKQQLSINVPQIAVRKSLKGIAPESSWDKGINGFRLNYDVNVSHSSTKGSLRQNSDNVFALLQPGGNIGDWRIRNQVTAFKSSYSPVEWNRLSSYAETDVRPFKSTLTLGEKTPSSDIFDPFDFRGVQIATNDRMMPYYFRQYGPVIRGIADKQIRLTVSQNGNVIYSDVLPPGPYAVDDLSVSGQSGELLVTTEDPEGNRRQYTVTWQSPAIAVREKYFRYDALVGEYISPTSNGHEAKVGQLTAIYGLPKNLTVYGGVRTAPDYLSYLTGAGASLGKAGSISFDRTASVSEEGKSVKKGEIQRLRYSGVFNDSKTSVILTGAYSPSVNYRTLSDALSGNCHNADAVCNNGGLRKRFDVNYRQTLPLGLNVYTTYSIQTNHNSSTQSSHGVGFSTFIPSVGYLSADYVENRRVNFSDFNDTDRVISASMNIPFSWHRRQNMSSSWRMQSSSGNMTQDYGVNGSSLDQTLSWNINQSRNLGGDEKSVTSYAFLSMANRYADTELYASGGNGWRQYGGAISGGLVLHSGGLTAGRELGETIALIDADGAKNVAIPREQNVLTDSSGYAIVTSLSPYQVNSIHLDPSTLEEEDDIIQTDLNVVPTSGAIVRASFKNNAGKRILINVSDSKGKPLSFGAVATLHATEIITGIVDEHGQLYMSGMPDEGEVSVKIKNGICKFNFDIKNNTHSSLHIIDSVCL
ncbi:fimbria/pilus outer membrane usher protein [Serratia fonticola]